MSTFFCYPDNEVRSFKGKPVPYLQQNATQYWLKHFENSLYLTFLAKNETTFQARGRASKELGIAQKKMEHWRRHPNWDQVTADREVTRLKRMWETRSK